MTELWHSWAKDPGREDCLPLVDVAFHLKFFAYRDTDLREQLRDAWSWVLKTGEPTPSLALRSNRYAEAFGREELTRQPVPSPIGAA